MNYNRSIIITLLALLSLCSVLARANDRADFDIFTSHINDRINKIQADIDKRGLTTTTQRQTGGATVTVAKNYPIVPYDPNHPNVQKQKKSSFAIKANAKTLAGRFARGLNGVALGYAVVDLLGDGIDWVLDPENNAVVFKSQEFGIYQILGGDKTGTVHELCSSNGGFDKWRNNYGHWGYITCRNGTVLGVQLQSKTDTLSLDTLANHVINNDNSTTNITNNITNHYHAAVTDTLVEQINKGEHDTEISTAVRNVSQPDDSPSPSPSPSPEPDEPQLQDQPSDESKPFEFPAFCDWAKPVCDFIDWVKQEPPEPPPPEQVSKPTLSDLGIDDERFEKRVHFSGQCPSGNFEFSANGLFFSKPIPYHHFCDLLIKLKPWLLAFVYLSTAYFVVSNL